MSDTPRTDAEASDGWSGDAMCVSVDFARTLERSRRRNIQRAWDYRKRCRTLEREIAEADRRAGAAERKLEQAKLDFAKHRESDKAVARSVWATHEQQFKELSDERDSLRAQLESANRDTAAMRDAFESIKTELHKISSGEPETWGFVSMFLEIVERFEKPALSSPVGKYYVRRDVLEKCADAIAKGIEHPNWHFEVACGGREALTAVRAELERTQP